MTYLQVLENIRYRHDDKYKNDVQFNKKITIIDNLMGDLLYFDGILKSGVLYHDYFLKLKEILTELDIEERDEKLKKIIE
jgi:hypothetical protein